MIDHSESLCTKARRYYLDYILRGIEVIGHDMHTHIAHCDHCQKHVDRLTKCLRDAEGVPKVENVEYRHARSLLLVGQLEYVDIWVGCPQVRPFLPALASKDLQMKVGTPITLHAALCPQCSEDFLTIQDLGVHSGVLSRFGRLLADTQAPIPSECPWTREIVPAVVRLQFGGIDCERLNHLCTCRSCRNHLSAQRKALTKRLRAQRSTMLHDELECQLVAPQDYFNCVVPYNFNPCEHDLGAQRQRQLRHMAECHICQAVMWVVHQAIYHVFDRPDSDIKTLFRFGKDLPNVWRAMRIAQETPEPLFERPPAEDFERGPYERNLSRGRLRPELPQPQPQPQRQPQPKPEAKTTPSKRTPRLVAAVAAVLAIALPLTIPWLGVPAGNYALATVMAEWRKVKNACLVQKKASDDTVVQKKWMSKALQAQIFERNGRFVWRDLANGLIWTKDPSSPPVSEPIPPERLIQFRRQFEDPRVSFEDASRLPQGYQWLRLPGQAQVYDLTWAVTKEEITHAYRFRWFFENRGSAVPTRIDCYQRAAGEQDYTLTSRYEIVVYSSDAEISDIIKKEFGGAR